MNLRVFRNKLSKKIKSTLVLMILVSVFVGAIGILQFSEAEQPETESPSDAHARAHHEYLYHHWMEQKYQSKTGAHFSNPTIP